MSTDADTNLGVSPGVTQPPTPPNLGLDHLHHGIEPGGAGRQRRRCEHLLTDGGFGGVDLLDVPDRSKREVTPMEGVCPLYSARNLRTPEMASEPRRRVAGGPESVARRHWGTSLNIRRGRPARAPGVSTVRVGVAGFLPTACPNLRLHPAAFETPRWRHPSVLLLPQLVQTCMQCPDSGRLRILTKTLDPRESASSRKKRGPPKVQSLWVRSIPLARGE